VGGGGGQVMFHDRDVHKFDLTELSACKLKVGITPLPYPHTSTPHSSPSLALLSPAPSPRFPVHARVRAFQHSTRMSVTNALDMHV
jgi:hypothetical protein